MVQYDNIIFRVTILKKKKTELFALIWIYILSKIITAR